jgi:hypothetical protein
VPPGESVASFETFEAPLYECRWIESNWIARPNLPLGDRGHEPDGVRMHEKQMHAPVASRIGLHMVKEMWIPLLDQTHLKVVPVASNTNVLVAKGMTQTTEIEIGGQVLFENSPYPVAPGELDGDEIAQQKVGEGREIVLGHDLIYAGDIETLFQKYVFKDFGADRRLLVNQCRLKDGAERLGG